MLEEIKKHNITFGIAFVLMVIGLLYWGQDQGTGSGNPKAVTVNGKTYSYKEAYAITDKYNNIARDLQLISYSQFLGNLYNSSDDVSVDLVTKYQVFNEQVEKFGLQVTDEDVATHLRENIQFFQKDNKFSQEAYNNYVKRNERRGYTEANILEVVKKDLQVSVLGNLFVEGWLPYEASIKSLVYSYSQSLGLEVATIATKDIQEKELTEDELKQYWEANQNQFLSEEKRTFEYAYIKGTQSPLSPTKPEEVKAGAEGYETYQKALKAYEEAQLAYEALVESNKNQKTAMTSQINNFIDDLILEKKGADFSATAKQYNLPVSSVEKITFSEFPQALRPLRTKSRQPESFYDLIFGMKWSDNEEFRVSHVYPVASGGFFVFKLNEIIKPEPLSYELARPQVEVALKSLRKKTALDDFSAKSLADVKQLIKDGKSFKEACQQLKLTTQTLPVFDMRNPNAVTAEMRELFEVARTLNVGDLTEVITSGEDRVFASVSQKSLTLDEQMNDQIKSIMEMDRSKGYRVLSAWFSDLVSKAEVSKHLKNL